MGDNILPEGVLTVVAQVASKAAIEFYKGEIAKAEKNKKSKRINDVKRQLASYRQIKRSLKEGEKFTPEEENEYRWKFLKDLMESSYAGKSDRIIDDEEKRRQENLYTIYRIDNAMKLYKEECDLSFGEEDKRRYRVIYDMHIAEKPMSTQELAEREQVSDKTIYRDMGIAYKIIAFYLYGI